MGQWLGAHAALEEYTVLFPAPTLGSSSLPVSPAPGELDTLFWTPQIPVLIRAHEHKIENKTKFKKLNNNNNNCPLLNC